MLGDVQICTTVCSAAKDYAMNSGFYLTWQLKKVGAVVFQLINGLMYIGQSGVTLLFLEAFGPAGPNVWPAP